jgi:hypothetical protein
LDETKIGGNPFKVFTFSSASYDPEMSILKSLCNNNSSVSPPKDYLQPAQDEDEQPPQPDPLDVFKDSLADRPMPNRERSFSVLPDPHFSQVTIWLAPKTSFSNSAWQDLHRYS